MTGQISSTTATLRIRQVVLDCRDPRALAEVYRELFALRYRAGAEPPAEGQPDPRGQDWLVLRASDGSMGLAFQQVPDLPPPTWPTGPRPQMLHLDTTVPTVADLTFQVQRALGLGATQLSDRSNDPQEPLFVLADPAGRSVFSWRPDVRIVVVGGSGHIGSFLIPRLVTAGHDVVVLSRGRARPYLDHPAWDRVGRVVVDRHEADAAGSFGHLVADLNAAAVIDLVCFTVESARMLIAALRGTPTHLVHCGSIWMPGPSLRVPILEADSLPPTGEYGIAKAMITQALRQEKQAGGLLTTSVHPGQISGPGWAPIGPLGNLDPQGGEPWPPDGSC